MSDFLGHLVARTLFSSETEALAGTVQPRLRARFEPQERMATFPLPPPGDDTAEGGEAATVTSLTPPAAIPFPQPAQRPPALVTSHTSAAPSPPTTTPERALRPSIKQRETRQAQNSDQPAATAAAAPTSLLSTPTTPQPRPRTTGQVAARSALQTAAGTRPPVVALPEQQQRGQRQDASPQSRPFAAGQSDTRPAPSDRLLLTTIPYAGEQMIARLRMEIQRLQPLSPPMEDGRVRAALETTQTTQAPSPYPGVTALMKEDNSNLEATRPKGTRLPGQPATHPLQFSAEQRGYLLQTGDIYPQILSRLRVALRQDNPPAGRASEVREVPPPPAIVVHIGRIEVRAAPPVPAPRRAQSQGRPAVQSLDDYLRRRNGQGGAG